MIKKYFFKINLMTLFFFVLQIIINPVSTLYAFRDTTSEVANAINEFDSEGLFGSFIYKYGQDLFRPDGSVTRTDMILLLKEYNILIKRLNKRDIEISDKLKNINSNSSPADIDSILKEFQNVLDPMLKNSQTIKNMKRKINTNLSSASPSTSLSNTELQSIKKDITSLKEIILTDSGSMNSSSIGSSNQVSKAQLKELKSALIKQKKEIAKNRNANEEQLEDLFREISYVKKQIEKNEKNNDKEAGIKSSKIELSHNEEDIKELNSRIDKLEKSVASSKTVKNASKEFKKTDNADLSELKDEIDKLSKTVFEQQKDIAKIARSSNKKKSGESGGGFPFWARLSMGFSTVILFFIAR